MRPVLLGYRSVRGGSARAGRVEPPVAGYGVFVLYVGTTSGRSARVRFEVRRDTVEVWHWGRLHGVFVRDVLAGWLADPGPALSVDEVTLSLDRMVDVTGRVAVTLPDVRAWTFSPAALEELRARVNGPAARAGVDGGSGDG